MTGHNLLALAAFPTAVSVPDTLALIAIGLAVLAIILAFIAMTMLTIADRRAAAAERAQRAEIWASLPPHFRAATQPFTSLERDEDDR